MRGVAQLLPTKRRLARAGIKLAVRISRHALPSKSGPSAGHRLVAWVSGLWISTSSKIAANGASPVSAAETASG
jgi:hypothetical protein